MPRNLTVSRPLIIWTLATITAGLLIPLIVQAATVNQWSIGYLRSAISDTGSSVEISDPPSAHGRASLWLAKEMVEDGEPGRALKILSAELASGNSEALKVQGRALEALGDFPAAVRSWVRAKDFRGLHEAGMRARNEGRMENALAAYEALEGIDPELGTILLAEFLWGPYQSPDTALAVLRKGVNRFKDSPERARWLNRLGDFHRELGQYELAEATYLQVLEEYPEAWEPYLGLGWVRYGRGEGAEAALVVFRQVTEGAPDEGRGYQEMARLLAKEGRGEEADALYQMALDRNPDDRWLPLERGNAARERGDLILALEVYAETIRQFPEFAAAYYEWAWALNLAGRPEVAKVAIERALALKGTVSASYLLRAGQILEALGDSEEAAVFYRTVLELQPENAAARVGLDRHLGGSSDE